MSHTPHELPEEFPQFADKMVELKLGNGHFAKLYDEYHEVNTAVYRAETNLEPTDQFHEEDLRKKRAALKDQIYRMLTAA
jgi:uncharacterized protein YdcH (DUF465 family)